MQLFSTKLNARSFGGLHMSQEFRDHIFDISVIAVGHDRQSRSLRCHSFTHAKIPESQTYRCYCFDFVCAGFRADLHSATGSTDCIRRCHRHSEGCERRGDSRCDRDLTNTETGVMQTAHTTATGTYNFTVVPYGHYTLLVQHPGFQDVAITGFDVHVQVIVTEDATMPTGSAQQTKSR